MIRFELDFSMKAFESRPSRPMHNRKLRNLMSCVMVTGTIDSGFQPKDEDSRGWTQ